MKTDEKVSLIIELILHFVGLWILIGGIIAKDVIMLGVGAIVYLSSTFYIYTAKLGNKIDELMKNQ